jgi:hypothetical protein
MNFSNYGALSTLEWVVAQSPGAAPTNLFIQLHTGDPGPDGTNNVASNSERKQASWTQAINKNTDGRAEVATDAAISWPAVSATETYSYISLWDDLTAGNCWYTDQMTSPIPVTSGGAFVFPTGQTIDHV